MVKFIPAIMSIEDTNPTKIANACVEYAKIIGEFKIKLDFNVPEFIDAKMLSHDADGDKLIDEFERGLHLENDAEKEKFRKSISDRFVKIPVEFAIQAIDASKCNVGLLTVSKKSN